MSIARSLYKAVLSKHHQNININDSNNSNNNKINKSSSECESIFVYDDPLAAVDVHVGKDLFHAAFLETLKDYTRIVTLSSNYHFLPYFDRIIVIESGKIVADAKYNDIITQCPQYNISSDSNNTSSISCFNSDITAKLTYTNSNSNSGSSSSSTSTSTSTSFYKQYEKEILEKRSAQQDSASLMVIEDQEKGAVSLSTYIRYFTAASVIYYYYY